MSGINLIATALLLGLAAGILSGMFGIGGGLIIVPALIILFQFEAKTAIGTSLYALMWPVGLLGVIDYWRRGEMRSKEGLLIAVGLFFGAFLGAKITGAISETAMKRLYGIFLLIMGFYFIATASARSKTPAQPPAAQVQLEE